MWTKDNPNSIIMLVGDFNAGSIDWENYVIKSNANNIVVHERILEIIVDNDVA